MFLFFVLSPFCPEFLSVRRQTSAPFPPRFFLSSSSSFGHLLQMSAAGGSYLRWLIGGVKLKKHRCVLCGWEIRKIRCLFFSAVHFVSLFSTSGSSDSCRKCSSATKVFSEAGFYTSVCLSVTLPVLFECCHKQFLVDAIETETVLLCEGHNRDIIQNYLSHTCDISVKTPGV